MTDPITWSIVWGDGNTSTVPAGTTTTTASHVFAEKGTDTISATATTDDGTYPAATSITVAVADAPLTPSPATVSPTEGIAFSGAVATFVHGDPSAPTSDFSGTINWGDGSSTPATFTYDSTHARFNVNGTHTYAEEGTYSIAVAIADVDGSTASTTVTAHVADAPLSSSAGTTNLVEGAAFSGVVATFTDADPGGTLTDYSSTITWGDGTASAGTIAYNASQRYYTVSGTHTFAEEGAYATSVAIADGGGATTTAHPSFVVADAPLTATAKTFTPTEGIAFTGTVATFTDADPGGTATDYSTTIAWGDGTTSAGTVVYDSVNHVFDVNGTKTYPDESTYLVSVTIKDAGGASASTTSTANVADAALTPTALSLSIPEDSTFSGTVATFTDANPSLTTGDFAARITWGDGDWSPGAITYNSSTHVYSVGGSESYASEGTYAVSVLITDSGGSSATAASTLTVTDAPLTATPATINATEGIAFTGTVATFTDADPGGTTSLYTATITWGDSNSSAGTIGYNASTGAFTVVGSHAYAEEGSYAVSVAIKDTDGATTSPGTTAHVADATPVVSVAAIAATEGAAFSGTVATFVDPDPNGVVGDYTTTIAWGDGTTSPGTLTYNSGAGNFSVAGSHTYAEEGSFTLGVTVADSGGATGSGTLGITVADAALTASTATVAATEGIAFTGTVATFTDADPGGTASDYSATITWGDGTSSAATIVYDSAHSRFDVNGTHTYADEGTYGLAVALADSGARAPGSASSGRSPTPRSRSRRRPSRPRSGPRSPARWRPSPTRTRAPRPTISRRRSPGATAMSPRGRSPTIPASGRIR